MSKQMESGDRAEPASAEDLRRFAALLRLRAETYAHAASSIRSTVGECGLLSGGYARATRDEALDLINALTERQAQRTALLAEHLERLAARQEIDGGSE